MLSIATTADQNQSADTSGQIALVNRQLAFIQDNANLNPGYSGPTGNTLPYGLPDHSLVGRVTPTGIELRGSLGGGLTQPFLIGNATTSYLALTKTAAGPTTTDLPADQNYGWHLNTATGKFYFALNNAGAIVLLDFVSVGGTLGAAQHGNLAGAGPFHDFAGLTGTLSSTQHGAQTVGTLHAVAGGGVNGFMANADKAKLDDITGAGTASNLLNATEFYLNGSGIINSRHAITAPAVGETAGATYTSTEQDAINHLVTLANDLRAKLVAIGTLFA